MANELTPVVNDSGVYLPVQIKSPIKYQRTNIDSPHLRRRRVFGSGHLHLQPLTQTIEVCSARMSHSQYPANHLIRTGDRLYALRPSPKVALTGVP